MSWLSRLFGGSSDSSPRPQRLDYLSEALVLERQGDYDAALTSYRLALRDNPNDRTGRLEEAVRAYRRSLEIDPTLSGAHYGLAFLLIKRNDAAGAEKHLAAFLRQPPTGEEAERWIRHAQSTLDQLRHEAGDTAGGSAGGSAGGTAGGGTAASEG